MKKLNCSIGVIVYNEIANIENLLNALEQQELENVIIDKIYVVSSASSDGTDELVQKIAKKNNKINLIIEKERNGKSSAINKFLEVAKSEILVIESGDTIPNKDTIEKLISVFSDPDVGMSGGRPLPENSDKTFIGYSVNLLWNLHHKMALHSPKLGEMIAFRNIVKKIPIESAVDEASIEAIIRKNNFSLKYLPDAIIHNKGPENISDFIKQRRRIASGHYWLEQTENYSVSSQNKFLLLKITLQELIENPFQFFFLTGTMFLEFYCRFLGWYDFNVKKKNPYKWDIASSTKKLKIRIK